MDKNGANNITGSGKAVQHGANTNVGVDPAQGGYAFDWQYQSADA